MLIFFFIFINALIGKQLFGNTKNEENRLNFETFGSAMFTVFVSLTGKWIDPMRATMEHNNKAAVAVYFVEIVLLGNFMLLNLFLAILLNHVGAIEDEKREEL
jgi:hypothetical protein